MTLPMLTDSALASCVASRLPPSRLVSMFVYVKEVPYNALTRCFVGAVATLWAEVAGYSKNPN